MRSFCAICIADNRFALKVEDHDFGESHAKAQENVARLPGWQVPDLDMPQAEVLYPTVALEDKSRRVCTVFHRTVYPE